VPQKHRTEQLSAAFRHDHRYSAPEDITKRYDAFVGPYGMDASATNRGEATRWCGGVTPESGISMKDIDSGTDPARQPRDFATIVRINGIIERWLPGTSRRQF